MEDESSRQALIIRIAQQTPPEERLELSAWLGALLAIRESKDSVTAKAKRALKETLSRRVIWPTVKLMGKEVKRLGWDERSASSRWGIGVAATAVALFGGQSAGIAALGTAIGVPLWVVFGAGAKFATMLLSQLTRKPPAPQAQSTDQGTMINAVKDRDGIHRA